MTSRNKEGQIPSWGPWSPGCKGHDERKAQLRCLQGIIACHHSSDHPLITLLRAAEDDPMRFVEAFDAMEKMPALYRRRVLSVLSAVTWPPYNAEHDSGTGNSPVAAGGPPWTPKVGEQ